MIKQKLPQGFSISAPTMENVAELKTLFHTIEIDLDGEPESTEDELKTWLQSSSLNIETDVWVVRNPQGEIIALASVGHQQHARIYSGVDVHPDYCGQGIGTYLRYIAEERARQMVPLADPGVRVSLSTGVSSKNGVAHRILENLGYTLTRNFWRMGIELTETPPAPQWAEGISLTTARPGMERAVYEADEEAFEDHWGHVPHSYEEFEHWHVKRDSYDPSLWLLAMDGDQIAGVAICADEGDLSGWVHSLAVRRPWRRKGLGLALLQQAFGEFYRRGIYKVYLGVDAQSLTGATRLYERAGMHKVRQYDRYEKELRAGKEISTVSVDA